MAFNDILKDMVEGVDGGGAATLMGMDGVAVHKYSSEGNSCDVETIGIEYGKVISETINAAGILDLGGLEEITVVTRAATLVIRMVTAQYYIAFAVGGKTAAGKAHYLIRMAALKARKELEA